HLGTPLATQLLAAENSCVVDLLSLAGLFALARVDIIGTGVVNGAVGDLAGDGAPGGNLSPALSALPVHPPFPIAYVSGQMGASNLAGLSCTFCLAAAVRTICGNDPLAEDLTATAWPSLFGQPSDAIVPLES